MQIADLVRHILIASYASKGHIMAMFKLEIEGTVDSKVMAKAIIAMAKVGLTVKTTAIVEPKVAKIYDATTCVKIDGAGKLSAIFDTMRGGGMMARVRDALGCDMGLASTLVSAEAASKKNKVDYLYIVPNKAEAVKLIIDTL